MCFAPGEQYYFSIHFRCTVLYLYIIGRCMSGPGQNALNLVYPISAGTYDGRKDTNREVHIFKFKFIRMIYFC